MQVIRQDPVSALFVYCRNTIYKLQFRFHPAPPHVFLCIHHSATLLELYTSMSIYIKVAYMSS
jgi:hypothetical protein